MTAPTLRLITHASTATGRAQMALDALLLARAAERGISSCRWYQWSGPTVSLGYFQTGLPAELQARFVGLPVVRRLTGGGASLHHHELTYSLALAAAHPLCVDPRQLYDRVHEAVIGALRRQGVAVGLRGAGRPELGENYLCFARGDSFDVVCEGFKVLGSAQRRRRGAVLQHGSLLWARSAWAPEFPGICDLADVKVDAERLQSSLREVLVEALGGEFDEEAELPADELSRFGELEREFGDPC
ncbi:MAG: biotin/lipoate A/B protein ligase family protein [Planctomycetaceae bacterium]